MMINFLFDVLRQTWEILEEASVFLLFGFLLAGMLGILVPGRLLTRLVGAGKIKSVLWGSVLGAPLPLCSCGVLPTPLGLRKEGATPGATPTGRHLRPAKNPAAGSDSDQCQHAGDAAEGLDHAHGQDHHHDHAREANSQPDSGATSGSAAVDATRRIIRYGFVELLDDISWWLALGVV